MKINLFVTLLLSFLIGCSTTQFDEPPLGLEELPPTVHLKNFSDIEETDEFLKLMIKRAKNQGTLWWAKYKKAQLHSQTRPNQACILFSQLALDDRFPLNDLATIRSWQTCRDRRITANLPSLKSLKKRSWLTHLIKNVKLEILARSPLPKNKMNAYIQKSKVSRVLNKKIEYTRNALKIARSLRIKKVKKQMLARLDMLEPRKISQPAPHQLLKVAYDFRKVRNFKAARATYNKILKNHKLSHAVKITALKGIRTTYKIENRIKEYISATEALATYSRKNYFRNRKNTIFQKNYVSAHTLLAKTYWTKGQDEKARKSLIGLANTMRRKKEFIPQLYWIIGRIHEERAEFNKAISWFQKALRLNPKNHSLKKRLHWYLAWNLSRTDKYSKAIQVFKKGLSILKEKDLHSRAKFQYWLADTYLKSGSPTQAKNLFDELKHNDSIGYYGLLAHRATGTPIISTVPDRQPAQSAVKINHKTDWYNPNYLHWVLSLDEEIVSLGYIRQLSRSLRKNRRSTVADFRRMLKLYSKAGHHQTLLLELATLPKRVKSDIQRKSPDLFFPQPFKEIVEEKSRSNHIKPELIYAIMRQESAFNRRARSPADAFGLMQILPKVATNTAIKNNIPFQKADDLYHPSTNIAIGSALIKSLMEKHQGQFIPAVASYNAAETAIQGWFKTRFRGNSVNFIEDIPYKETRNYIKLVLRNLIFYEMLSKNKSQLDFPEWALELKPEPFRSASN